LFFFFVIIQNSQENIPNVNSLVYFFNVDKMELSFVFTLASIL
jgi:hypothetical protein